VAEPDLQVGSGEPTSGEPAPASDDSLAALGPLLDRLEELLGDIEALDEDVHKRVFELLDGVDAVHRLAVTRLADAPGLDLTALRLSDPAIDWLFEAYGVGVDDLEAASNALEQIRPYLHEHGGEVEVLGVQHGIVRVRLIGACSGCTSAGETLRHGVEEALRENLPGFVSMDVAPDDGAAAHAPPSNTVLLQITQRPA